MERLNFRVSQGYRPDLSYAEEKALFLMDQKLSGTPSSSIGGGRGDDGNHDDGGGGSRGGCGLLSLPLDSSTMTRTSLTPPLLRRSNSFDRRLFSTDVPTQASTRAPSEQPRYDRS